MAVVPRLACTVLLVRDRGGLEVLMVERHEQSHFASALVFPGGLVDPEDGDAGWAGLTVGEDPIDATERSVRIAGYRELHEETGILLAQAEDAKDWRPPPPGERPFMEAVAAMGLKLDLDAMAPFAHWITPEMAPKRFDTHFRLCGIDTDHVAVHDGAETVSCEWISPARALEMGEAGERRVLFPTKMNLKMLAQASSVDEAIAQARARRVVTVLPHIERRPDGAFLVIPAEAGYGVSEEPAGSMRP